MKTNTRRILSGGHTILPSLLLINVVLLCSSSSSLADSLRSGESSAKSHNHNQHEILGAPSALEALPAGVETHFVYMNLKKSAQLQCSPVELSSLPANLPKDSKEGVKWSKTVPNKLDMSEKCLFQDDDDDDHDDDDDKSDDEDDDKSKCSYIYSYFNSSKPQFKSTLRLHRMKTGDYGEYECHNIDGKLLRKFVLRGELRATRKTKTSKPETEHSVFVNEGTSLHLYCNYSQAESDHYINITEMNYVTVSWYKVDDTVEKSHNGTVSIIDITQDLRSPEEGKFQNFTEILPNQFLGNATNAHRGEYICSVNVKPHSKSIIHEKMFPVEYKFHVRVQDSHRWMIPGGILLVEIICMAIFTACIWKRDDAKEKEENNDLPQDSDDDEEESPKLK